MNVHLWPIPVVQAMKFIRGRPTAACDPGSTFTLPATQIAAFSKAVIALQPEAFRM
jgi:hypothetical protein